MSVAIALVVSIIALASWTGWVVRTGRAGRSARYIPVVGGLGALACEVFAIRETFGAFGATVEAGNKATMLAEHLGHAAALQVGAWACISVAALILMIFSLRQPSDPDGPSARVVREPRRDR
jgi:hypothetical protein